MSNSRDQGRALFKQGQHQASVSAFRQWLIHNPTDAAANHDLSAPLFALGDLAGAEDAARAAVTHNPDFALAWSTLATIQTARGQVGTPLKSILKATQLEPHNLVYQNRLGTILIDQGEFQLSVRTFQNVLRKDPEYIDAAAGMATALERLGELEEAFKIMAPIVNETVIHAQLGTTWSRVCRRLKQPEKALGVLISMLKANIQPKAASMLLAELGATYDAIGQTDAAFAAYTKANDLRTGTFNVQAHVQLTTDLIQTFSVEAMQRLPRAENTSEVPIFIVGMPRSGTSLMEQILSSHPDVHGAGELEDLRAASLATEQVTDGRYPTCGNELSQEAVNSIGAWYLERRHASSPNAKRVTDKMPQNFQHLGMAGLLLPNARVIHCMRDPLDTALSCFFQGFKDALAWSNQLEWLGVYLQQYQRLMNHWRTVQPLPMLEVRYEDLVQDPEPHIRQIIAFCGLPWDDAVLEHHRSKRTVATASYAQATRPIYQSSAGRAQRYIAHLTPISRAVEKI